MSARACAGILRRAEARGKTIPPLLSEALLNTVRGVVGTITASDAEKQFTNNQAVDSGMLVVEPSVYDMTHACDVIRATREVPTLQARMGTGGNQIPLVLDRHIEPKVMSVSENQRGEVVLSDRMRSLTSPGGKPGQGNPVVLEPKSPCYCLNDHGGRRIDNQTDCLLVLQENGNSRAIGVGVSPPLKTTTVPCFSTGGIVGTLTARDAEKQFANNQAVDSGMLVTLPQAGVRRLTPVECERLQGFPTTGRASPGGERAKRSVPTPRGTRPSVTRGRCPASGGSDVGFMIN